jgi:5-bromo-4-chloroindolyl phosphate hydrolysis protein
LWKAPDDFQEKNSWYMEQAKKRKQMEALEKAKKDYEYSIRNLEAAEKKYKEIQAAINGDKNGV